jgi:uncharacterized membrane protein
MKLIPFNDSAAQRVYNDYINRCRKCLKSLPEADTEECLLEINSHIYEYLDANKATDEMDNLLNILDRLGAPEETLKEFVAAKKINQAVKTFNPLIVMQALYLNIRNGVLYVFLSLLFIIFISFPFLMVLKLIYPNTVGCFIGDNSFYFGFIGQHQNATEILGNWFIPVTALIAALLYLLIITILKFLKHKK